MNSRRCSLTGRQRFHLDTGWEIASAAPGNPAGPDPAALQALNWVRSPTLATVAAMLRAAGRWTFHSAERFDAQDWWYRLRFHAPDWESASEAPKGAVTLGFEGLATVADVWLNGLHLVSSQNMFVAHAVPALLGPGENELLLRFKSLDALLAIRRPRPRWRAPMVEHQQLRWFRTTVLGRTPGWSPSAAPVGPWRPIWIEPGTTFVVEAPKLHTEVQGSTGIVRAACTLAPRAAQVLSAELVLTRGGRDHRARLQTRVDAGVCVIDGELHIERVDLWWPHTHGEPALYEARLELQVAEAGQGPSSLTLQLGRIGFRTLRVDLADGNFALHVNSEKIFCRGACWTPPDVVALDTPAAAAAAALDQMVAAGMNMVRVGGTMVYENVAFLDACDARGVLLWQDFMFANMDYPDQDSEFQASVADEARQLLGRLSGRPCVAVLCGNSEGEQQAAMWGAPREQWSPRLFHELLPRLCADHAPGVPYWPSSAHGGAFPHQGNSGTTSYYGVGAYLRPLTDARRAEVRFATECLAFANVPEEALLAELSRAGSVKSHAPLWKARVPRDMGAGWDFDDVRDHYLREVFDLDPLALRYAEHDRYLDFSRAVSVEVMAAAFREWRRRRSGCNGALIWFLRDLWPGAGWGVIDSSGEPKSGYYGLARLLQPRTVFLTDEGGNGLDVHLINESATDLAAVLDIALIQGNGHTTHHRLPVTIPARQVLQQPVAAMLEGFGDLSYAYRFGPAPYEAVRASLLDTDDFELAHDFHFLLGHRRMPAADPGLSASAKVLPNGDLDVEVTAARLARFVTLRVPGYRAQDQYFHLVPGISRRIAMRRLGTLSEVEGEVRALNATVTGRITFS